MADESLMEKLLYRLIKKHIAGTTMSSAIAKTQELNKRNIPVSISFLSGHVDNKLKARYITTTYLELIRRISRLGLKANVHIPLDQLGYLFDKDLTADYLHEIVSAGNRYGVFVWAELENLDNANKIFKHAKGLGIAVPDSDAKKAISNLHAKAAKILFDENEKIEKKLKDEMSQLDYISRNINTAVIASPPEKLFNDLIKRGKYKKSFIFEFKLGYSESKIKKAQKKGAMISMSVPFGKDWTTYAMKHIPEGHMRSFVENMMLKEEAE